MVFNSLQVYQDVFNICRSFRRYSVSSGGANVDCLVYGVFPNVFVPWVGGITFYIHCGLFNKFGFLISLCSILGTMEHAKSTHQVNLVYMRLQCLTAQSTSVDGLVGMTALTTVNIELSRAWLSQASLWKSLSWQFVLRRLILSSISFSTVFFQLQLLKSAKVKHRQNPWIMCGWNQCDNLPPCHPLGLSQAQD